MKVLKIVKEINVSLLNIWVSINQHFPIENLSAYSYFIFDQCYISEKCILQCSLRNRWITVLAQIHSSIRFIFCIWQCSREVISESITRSTGWRSLLWVNFLSTLFLTAVMQLKLPEQSRGLHDPGLSDFPRLFPLESHSHSLTSLFKSTSPNSFRGGIDAPPRVVSAVREGTGLPTKWLLAAQGPWLRG